MTALTARATVYVPALTAPEVHDLLERNELVLVDVRETKEYEIEHIAGALLLPMSSLEPDAFPVLPGKQVVVHCAVGKRSEAVGRMLIKAGHDNIAHLEGGLQAWKDAGHATEAEIVVPDAPPSQAAFLCPPPGEILREEYLLPLKISQRHLAQRIGVDGWLVQKVVAGRHPVDAELSLRLARYFHTAADFWVQLQLDHDMEQARRHLGSDIRHQVRPRSC
ncbi:MAG: HigA family addiction module antitoxin [Brevirhabdus sp.]